MCTGALSFRAQTVLLIDGENNVTYVENTVHNHLEDTPHHTNTKSIEFEIEPKLYPWYLLPFFLKLLFIVIIMWCIIFDNLHMFYILYKSCSLTGCNVKPDLQPHAKLDN